jgi:hypothetical protein
MEKRKIFARTGVRAPDCPARRDSMNLWGEYNFFGMKKNQLSFYAGGCTVR